MPSSSEPAPHFHHPLEAIAPLRRGRRSALRTLGYTLIWNCLVGAALTAAEQLLSSTPESLPATLVSMLVVANVVGFLIHAGLVALPRLAPSLLARGGFPSRLAQLAVSALGAFFGIAVARALLSRTNPLQMLEAGTLTTILLYAAFSAMTIGAMLFLVERRVARATQAARQQEQIATASRLLAEARLRALQAQIEPHFLYNTLANVLSLIDTRPDQARHMLARFIDYLRASLAASRAESATLGGELDQAGAYLDVLKVRMGARLRYRVEADPACRLLPIAPMLLQPLVENAVMHGIEPKLDGGDIVVRAHSDGAMLCVEVADSGMGLGSGFGTVPPRPGGGVGLSNLRERVRQLHGPDAQLQLFDNQPCGVTARLLLPVLVPSSTIPAP